MNRIADIFTVAAAGLLLMPATTANACQFGYCWGAVGVGPDGVAGHASRQNTAPDAMNQAQAYCQDKCTTVEVFNDSCAVLMLNSDGEARLGLGPTLNDATVSALETCRSNRETCYARVSTCSLP